MFYIFYTHTKTKTKNRLYINETAVVFSDCGRFIMNRILTSSKFLSLKNYKWLSFSEAVEFLPVLIFNIALYSYFKYDVI